MTGPQFRSPFDPAKALQTADVLQPILTDLTDLALLLKHAHWNVRGALFLSIHEQLDAIVDAVRDAGDEVAERMVTLGQPADGLSHSIASKTRLNALRVHFLSTHEVIESLSDRLQTMIGYVREGIEATANLDPVTQDLLIGIASSLEIHLWKLQSQQL